jgi:bacteriocin biosynthesis cyclodehydratase domain-containing protein
MSEMSTSEGGSAEPPLGGAFAGLRPRLRQDVVFAESDDGVYLQRPGDQFVLKGQSVYRWMALLAPRLNGEHTVEQLSSGLSDGHRKTLADLIGVLAERGYVHDAQATDAGRIPPEVRAAFGRQIDYVAHFAYPGEAGFNAFRESRILLAGTTDLVTATGTGLLRNGAEQLDIADCGAAALDTLTAEAERLRASGCSSTVREGPGLGAAELAEYDLVIGAGADVRELLSINEIALGGGPMLLPLLVLGNRAVAGPLVRPGAKPCWECALLRQSSARSPADGVELWRAAALGGRCAAESCPPHLARMLGTMLAFDAFRLRTGVFPPETERAVLAQDLDTAESEREPLLPHPLCRSCSRDREAAGTAHPGDALISKNGGVLSCYRDAALQQSPVRTGRVVLPSVDGPDTAQREITAFDLDTLENARERAVQIAATCYAEEVAGRGSVECPPGVEQREVVPASRLSIHSGFRSTGDGPRVPGRSVVDDRPCWLPAAAAYPLSRHNHAMSVERTSAGAACEASFEEATSAGLLSALGFAGLRAALRGERPAQEFEPTGEDVDFLLRVAHQLRHSVRVLDLPGAEPAFACVVVAGEGDARPVWALGTGYARADAVAAGLRDVVGTLAAGTVDRGNPVLPDLDLRDLAAVSEPVSAREPTTHPEILELLRARGHDAFAVDTTPPDLRDAGLVTVRVLLSDQEARC